MNILYPLCVASFSGYYDFAHRLGRPEKDAALAEIIAEQRERSFRTYGYRRLWLVLKKRGIYRNPKTILRIMEKYGLLADIRRRRKWVNMGQQVHKYKNLLNRQFHPDRPNSKWVTDISYFHTKQGVLYLSMIRDLYDNSIVAYKTDTKQTVNLVLDTIRLAMCKEKKGSLQSCSSTATKGSSTPHFEAVNRSENKKAVSFVFKTIDTAVDLLLILFCFFLWCGVCASRPHSR